MKPLIKAFKEDPYKVLFCAPFIVVGILGHWWTIFILFLTISIVIIL